jgi:hypothetical protein
MWIRGLFQGGTGSTVSRCVDDFAVTRKVPSFDTYQDSDLIDFLDLLLCPQHFDPYLDSDSFHPNVP